MGSHCSKEGETPDTSNVCSSAEDPGDNTHEIPGFCAPINFFSGKPKREEYCGKIGDDEWEYDSQGGTCNYNDCHIPNGYHSGCCKGCCGVLGRGVVCRRKAYKGNDVDCCFRDMAWNKQKRFCFQSNNEKRTCKPSSRNITSTSCQDSVEDFCVGEDLSDDDTSWFKRWTPDGEDGKSCLYALNRNLFGNPNTPGLTSGVPLDPALYNNAEGFQWSRELMVKVFNKYRQQGFIIGALPGFNGYDDFQTTIFSLCSTTPGLCEEGLKLVCSGQTTETLLLNPELVPWCGCYMSDDEYQQYVTEFQVTKECTPICARQGVIPVASASGAGTIPCTQDVCVIDDVTISLSNTDVGGDINFSQFCGGCSGSAHGMATSSSNNGNTNINIQKRKASSTSCECFITNTNIDTASSMIGGDIDLNQTCGKSTCYRENPDFGKNNLPKQIEVPCNASNDFNPLAQEEAKEQEEEDKQFKRNLVIWLVVIGIVVIILIIVLLANLGGNYAPAIIPRYRPPVPWATKEQIGSMSIFNKRGLTPNTSKYVSRSNGSILNRGISRNSISSAHPGYAGSIAKRYY